MPKKRTQASANIFDAVSAPTRIQTLNLLATKGPLAYSEIMELLKFEPTKDAGKFVYHLRNLVSSGLVDLERGTKKYKITELGTKVITFSQDLEEYSLKKSGRLVVRTSKYVIEEFDRSKITLSLIEEAGVPPDLAEKISTEAEERLLQLPTRYLTAPLIREFVNAILIEKGLEDYRHKLTRLGMPVHDVTRAMDDASTQALNTDAVHAAAGNQVMREYMLLNALPKEIADAHLSGQIHISNSDVWMLKPSSLYHDLRLFLKHGLNAQNANLAATPIRPPRDLAEALMLTLDVLEPFGKEIAGEQCIDYFNLFLSPYIRKTPAEDVKKRLRSFLARLSLMNWRGFGCVTLGLEVTVPQHLKNATAVTPEGVKSENYQHYGEDARKVLWWLLEAALEQSEVTPLLNPHLILKFRPECLTDKYDNLLKKAHELAAKFGTLYIANLTRESEDASSYMATGERIGAEWTKDWEVDTLRTGCLDNVSINLPRIAYEARKNDERFFETLEKTIRTAEKALQIKDKVIGDRMRQKLLPYLRQHVTNESYYRQKYATRAISIIGLNEAVKFHIGYQLHEEPMAQHFAVQVLEHLTSLMNSISEKTGTRLSLSGISEEEASQRLTEHDVDRYGFSMVYAQGRKEHPYYTYFAALPDEVEISQDEKLQLEGKIHPMLKGGHFTPIALNGENTANSLLRKSKEICEKHSIGLFAYTYTLSYCYSCQKTFRGYKQRCPTCGTTQITHYARQSTRYLPLAWWSHLGRLSLIERPR